MIPFSRLLTVETRKLYDTRSGKIMTAALVALTCVFVAGRGFAAGPRFLTLVTTAGIGYGTLLPVLAIIAVTCEFAHRTALTTFVLEPRRLRVMTAKCVPPLVTAVVASLFAMAVAAPATAAVSAALGEPAVWTATPAALLGWSAGNVIVVAQALALAMMLLNAPAAIVVFLTAPMLWGVIGRLGDAGERVAGWLSPDAGLTSLSSGTVDASGAAHLAVALVLWVVVPAAVGVVRTTRGDVR